MITEQMGLILKRICHFQIRLPQILRIKWRTAHHRNESRKTIPRPHQQPFLGIGMSP